jgi:hypothetical protein
VDGRVRDAGTERLEPAMIKFGRLRRRGVKTRRATERGRRRYVRWREARDSSDLALMDAYREAYG